MNWHEYFITMLPLIAAKSKDTTKTSAIIVGPNNEIRSTGFNGMPRKFNDSNSTLWEKPEKYFWVEHAERNAIYNAARFGTSLDSCTMYASHVPCVDCGRAIIQSGITRVILDSRNLLAFSSKTNIYNNHAERLVKMFKECNVKLLISDTDGVINNYE
jgi:dCMP deaminase